ncbi:MAG: D-glycero-beta-D-manno-heptose 1,7-bisphosphate 7-phosphatase [Rhodocyclaceae bacterium]|nr:D-glycero-beta-D-manno-heptose 1,7-bisphosphate 7-phosphatase [Rhodocyclaceae bacterium]
MKIIILDRDGVINHDSDNYIKSPEEWQPIDGSLEAIARLTHSGYRVVVATNQSGVGRALFDMDTLNAIHEKMLDAVIDAGGRIEAIVFCPHVAPDDCECRKPKAGMFREIEARFNADMSKVFAVGDSLRDLQAAIEVGAKPVLVTTGKGQKTVKDPALPKGVPHYACLADAVDFILEDDAQ